jgi:anti-anti-sigma regulatory factor
MLIEQNMTIYTAADLKPLILAEVRGSESPEFDLAGVSEIDSAGIQLLVMARREARSAGRTLRISGVRPAVSESLCFISLAAGTHLRLEDGLPERSPATGTEGAAQ